MDSATREGKSLSSSTSAHPCRIFSLAEIQSATENFHDKLVIRKGGFRTVFKGQITNEEAVHVVAIERWNPRSTQGELKFRAEIDILHKCRHCHLVSLIGYCAANKEKILVYEYLPNGSLYHHLHEAYTPLSWVRRLNIAIGAARGLDYLHTGVNTQHGVIHCNVKSSTILLDDNWEAVISDLGTKQWISYDEDDVKGTYGYLDPEIVMTGNLTYKSDVYAFGVVLFELLSGRRAVDLTCGEDHHRLETWAKECVKEGKLDQIVDPRLKGEISTKCLSRFAEMAEHCVRYVSKERPTMSELVASLQALLEQQEESIYLEEGEESA